jgi:flavin reductase (DIM6/NTAB) family NADH-FMN oxidoreductase RutF
MTLHDPRSPMPVMAAPTPDELRATLANFATGVVVVTTRDARGRPFGMTVNSFNAVSLDPPLVLWSLALTAQSLPIWRAATGFAVNILAEDQDALCRRFASRAEDRFEGVEWFNGQDGLPLLSGTVAALPCRFWARYPGGDHEIMLGRVLACTRSPRTPLVYCQGRLGALRLG